MAAALRRDQLNRLCSTPDTFSKAQSILRLANAKTRPGSGFVVKNTIAIPAVCAYLASEQLNTGEVSLQSAMSAACVSKAEFADILKTVRAALATEQDNNSVTNLTYAMLVDAYRVQPREHAIACMEDAEAALPQVDVLKERYGACAVSCAIFYWVCQLIEEPSVQERSLRQTYAIPPRSFKAVVTMLDKRCDVIAEQIKSYFKLPRKSATRLPQTTTSKTLTPAMTPSRKRTDNGASFTETPTKKRRIDLVSPAKSSTSSSPAKRSSVDTIAAFHAALKGSPAKLPAGQDGASLEAGPSTPRRPRQAKVAEVTATLVQDDSPSRSQPMSPVRPAARRRFRPVFLEQQQWCARDPKVERMWAAAETLRDNMVELYGRPFKGFVSNEDKATVLVSPQTSP